MGKTKKYLALGISNNDFDLGSFITIDYKSHKR